MKKRQFKGRIGPLSFNGEKIPTVSIRTPAGFVSLFSTYIFHKSCFQPLWPTF